MKLLKCINNITNTIIINGSLQNVVEVEINRDINDTFILLQEQVVFQRIYFYIID